MSTQWFSDKVVNASRKDSKEPMFNANGEINADSKADHFVQTQHLAQLMHDDKGAKAEKSTVTEKVASYLGVDLGSKNPQAQAQTDAFLQKQFSSQDNRLRFAQGEVPLILERLDYDGFSRRLLLTHPVAKGEVVYYEKDINVTALVVQDSAATIQSVVRGDRIFPPDFVISALALIPATEIAKKAYNIIDRTHDKTTFNIMLQEDRNAMKLCYAASQLENTPLTIAGSVNKNVVETLVKQIENQWLIVDKIITHRNDWGDLRSAVNSTDYDPMTARDVLLTGNFAKLWGYNFIVLSGIDKQDVIPQGLMFATTEPRFLGAIPIRIDLEVHPADQFVKGEFTYGWLFAENLGQVIYNPRAVAMASKTGTVIPSYLTR